MSAGTHVDIRAVEHSSSPPSTATCLECDLLVLGASFTGIELMHQLKRRRVLSRIDTIVVDAREVHGYIPLVHEMIAAEVDRSTYVLPTAEYVRSLPRTQYVVDTIVGVDSAARTATLASGQTIRARALVLALGSKVEVPASLSDPEVVPSPKFLEQSDAIRERLRAAAPGRLVVIGGGITGVELAGELAMWCRKRGSGYTVTLLEGANELLSRAGRAASRRAAKLLRQLGVELMFNVRVDAVEPHRVVFEPQKEERSPSANPIALDCSLVVWAGGIRPAANDALDVYRAADGWIEVDSALRCRNGRGETLSNVFAAGDAVRVTDESGRWPTMQRAIECIWQGKVLARNVETVLAWSEGEAHHSQPSLVRHRLVRDFPYGISLGAHSLVLYGHLVINLRALGVAFRRFLMRRYFARYKPLN